MEKPMTEIFSHNLRNALYMKGMTQSELAKAVKTTETSVSKWINGAAQNKIIRKGLERFIRNIDRRK